MTKHVTTTAIDGVVLIERPIISDDRGFFHEVERRDQLESTVAQNLRHAQWNHSRSRRSVLRGIHVAKWNKFIYVVRGNAQVVICDLRQSSGTFGQHVSFIVGERRRAAVFVPAGCGNSFLALAPWVDYMYSVDSTWYASGEFGVAWNDPDLAIAWKIQQPLLSERDQCNPTLRERFPERFVTADSAGRALMAAGLPPIEQLPLSGREPLAVGGGRR